MRVHPIYRNYPYSIHVDNGVPVLPGCFDERNVLQVGTQAYSFYSASKMRVHPIYRNYPYSIHVDNGVPVLPGCFDERNVLQVGTKAYPFYSIRIRRLHPIYRNYPYNIHVDGGVPVLPGCFDDRNVLQIGTQAYPLYRIAKIKCIRFTECALLMSFLARMMGFVAQADKRSGSHSAHPPRSDIRGLNYR